MTEQNPLPPSEANAPSLPIDRTDLTIKFSDAGSGDQRAHIEIAAEPLQKYLAMVEATDEDVDGRTISAALVQFCIGEAMLVADFRTIFGPRLDMEAPQSVVKSGKPFACVILIDKMPEVDWPDFQTFTLKRPTRPITPALIDAEIMQQQIAVGQRTPKTSPLAPGDHAICTLRLAVSDEVVLLEQSDLEITIPEDDGPITLFGQQIPELAGHLVGTSVGESIALDIDVPESHSDPSVRGKVATLNITVTAGHTVTPGSIDDVLLALDFKNEAMLRMQIDLSLKDKTRRDQLEVLTDQLFEVLAERTEVTVPDGIVRRGAHHEAQAIGQRMASQGMPHEEIMAGLAQDKDKRLQISESNARRRGLTKLLIRDFKVTTQELSVGKYIAGLAANLGRRPEDLRREIIEHDGISQVHARVEELACFECLEPRLTIEDVPADEWAAAEDSQAL